MRLTWQRGLCAASQAAQALPPHRHGGMGLQHYTEDVVDAARLSSAAVARCVLADGMNAACSSAAARPWSCRVCSTGWAWSDAIADLGAGPAKPANWSLENMEKVRQTQLQRVLEAGPSKAAVFSELSMAARSRSAH